MIVKFLGIIDIIAALLFWIFGIFHVIPESFVLFFACIIFAKGLIFVISEHIASVVDILVGIVMFASLSITLPKFVVIIFTFILLQKGIVSLIA